METILLKLSVDDLPKYFNYEIVCSDEEMTIIRSNLKSMKDINQWVFDFGEITNTRWISRNSDPKGERFVCWKKFVCYRAPYKKRESVKSTDCDATLFIKVKRNIPDVIIEDPYVQLGLPAEIRIKNQHTHDVTEDVIQYKRNRINQDLKYKFFEYFDSGLGIRESWRYHQRMLLEEYTAAELPDCEIFPSERAVRYWREMWRQINFKPGQVSYQARYDTNLIKDQLKAAHNNYKESEIFSDEYDDDVNMDKETIEEVVDLLRTFDARYGSSSSGLRILKRRMRIIKNRDGWETFLRSAGNTTLSVLSKDVETRTEPTAIDISSNRNIEGSYEDSTSSSRINILRTGVDEEETDMSLAPLSRIGILHSRRNKEKSHVNSISFQRINTPHKRRKEDETHVGTTPLSRINILRSIKNEEETDTDSSFVNISSNRRNEEEFHMGSTSAIGVKRVMKAKKSFPSKRPISQQNRSTKVRILTDPESNFLKARTLERAYVIKVINV